MSPRGNAAYSEAFGFITTALDLVGVSLIVFSTGGTATPFFVYYSFPMITASSRYGIKGGLIAAAVGTLTYGFIRFYFDWDRFDRHRPFRCTQRLSLRSWPTCSGSSASSKRNKTRNSWRCQKPPGKLPPLKKDEESLRKFTTVYFSLSPRSSFGSRPAGRQFLDSPQELDRELKSIEDDTRGSMKTIRQFLAGKETQPFPSRHAAGKI